MILAFPDRQVKEHDMYVVIADDWKKPGKMHTLGYARGDPAVIQAYYDNGLHKDVRVEKMSIETITRDMLDEKMSLIAERKQLYRRLGELEKELAAYGGRT